MPQAQQQPVNYIQREKALIAALAKNNYAQFDGDRDEALDFVASSLSRFTDYVNVVVREQVMVPIWQQRCERDDYIANVERLDKERRIKHNGAIDSVNMLNRMSKNLGLPPFSNVDTNDRHAVADMAGDYVNQVYNQGIGNGMYDATKSRNMDYDTKAHSREIRVPDYALSDDTPDPQFH